MSVKALPAVVLMMLVADTALALPPRQDQVFSGAADSKQPERVDLQQVRQSHRLLADQVLVAADAAGLPFAVVDKKNALLSVYRADGRLAGSTPVLLGRMPGDYATPGVGDRAQNARLLSTDRTTPAGKFLAEPGVNRAGEAIIWLDYANALALHRLRPSPAAEQRDRRMASPWPSDHRITAGCVVVPVGFFETVVQQVLGRSRSVVYVLAQDGKAELPLSLQVQARVATPPNP